MGNSLSDTIKERRLALGLTQSELADKLGITLRQVQRYENGMLPPHDKLQLLNSILNYDLHSEIYDENSHTEPDERQLSFLEKRRLKKNEHNPYLVPFVTIKAQAGYVKAYDQTIYVDTLEQYALPPGVNPQGAIWRYWEVEGDSMEPEFHSGDIILTSQVPHIDWENLRNFYLYIIVTEDKILFKRIFCKNAQLWVLISVNETVAPQQLISVEQVKEVWVYRRSIVNKAPTSKMYEIKV